MKRLAAIRKEPLKLDEVIAAVTRPEAGAIATFAGLVRNHAQGLRVTRLEYEAYPSMAEKEMARIALGIEGEIPDVQLAVLHRIGTLEVGDLAIVCAASSPHRDGALRACRALIDRIKESVPIWKREHGPEGPYWVGWRDARCAHSDVHSHAGQRRTDATGVLVGISVAILTVSDTRTSDNDTSGQRARQLIEAQGAEIIATSIVPDEPALISTWITEHARLRGADALIVTGGTGLAPRDRTLEAVAPLFSRTLDGFGETFRRLSFDEIGPRALLSRAAAGVVGSSLIFALPGSPKAVELALSKIIIPLLPHAVALLRGEGAHHHQEPPHEC